MSTQWSQWFIEWFHHQNHHNSHHLNIWHHIQLLFLWSRRITYHSVNLYNNLFLSHGLPAEYQMIPFILPSKPESLPVMTSKHYSNSTSTISATSLSPLPSPNSTCWIACLFIRILWRGKRAKDKLSYYFLSIQQDRLWMSTGVTLLVCSNLSQNQCCNANLAVQDGHMSCHQFQTAVFCPYIFS